MNLHYFFNVFLRYSVSSLFTACLLTIMAEIACDLCDADYVGYMARHLHQHIAECKYSAIGKHLLEAHSDKNLLNESLFRVFKKCHRKLDCLVYEMLFIKELRPS